MKDPMQYELFIETVDCVVFLLYVLSCCMYYLVATVIYGIFYGREK